MLQTTTTTTTATNTTTTQPTGVPTVISKGPSDNVKKSLLIISIIFLILIFLALCILLFMYRKGGVRESGWEIKG